MVDDGLHIRRQLVQRLVLLGVQTCRDTAGFRRSLTGGHIRIEICLQIVGRDRWRREKLLFGSETMDHELRQLTNAAEMALSRVA